VHDAGSSSEASSNNSGGVGAEAGDCRQVLKHKVRGGYDYLNIPESISRCCTNSVVGALMGQYSCQLWHMTAVGYCAAALRCSAVAS
jgi:hypothetical protein